jgi:hypothetical protein
MENNIHTQPLLQRGSILPLFIPERDALHISPRRWLKFKLSYIKETFLKSEAKKNRG